jgi:hypothetical protein
MDGAVSEHSSMRTEDRIRLSERTVQYRISTVKEDLLTSEVRIRLRDSPEKITSQV